MMSASDDSYDQPSKIRPFPRKPANDRRRDTTNHITSTQPSKDSKHIVCLAVLPTEAHQDFDYENVLLPALRNILELRPYYWQVAYSNDKSYGETTRSNVNGWMKYAQAYLIDISHQSFEMGIELGHIHGTKKKSASLIIVLDHRGTERRLPEMDGITRIEYLPHNGDHAIEEITKTLRMEFDKRGNIQQLRTAARAHYLSPLMMQKHGANEQLAKALSSVCKTMEVFITTEAKDICLSLLDHYLNIDQNIVTGYQKAIRKLLNTL